MSAPLEAVFYIHGISPDLNGRSHKESYSKLHTGIARMTDGWPDEFGGAEWGWNHDHGAAEGHELLAAAQRLLGSRAMPALQEPWDWTANPARAVVNGLRPLYLYGFGDIFYYVSTDGKQSIRQAISEQLMDYLSRLHLEHEDRQISLTLIGHSAGSVIAFDLLYYLYRDTPPAAAPDGVQPAYLANTGPRAARTIGEFNKLGQLARDGDLRIRRFITLGSPITPMACRNDQVLKILAADKRLDPKDYGLTENPPAFDDLSGPRWLNIWDRDDPIAWPVEPLMMQAGDEQVVQDLYVDVSDVISVAHNRYWDSRKVHKTISSRW